MNDFSHDISNWWWWVSVVGLSFLINILSAYIKPLFDKFFSKIFSSSTKSKLRVEKRLRYYRKNDLRFLELKHDLNSNLILTTLFLVISMFFFNLSLSILQFIGSIRIEDYLPFYIGFILCIVGTLLSLIFPMLTFRKILELAKVKRLIIHKNTK